MLVRRLSHQCIFGTQSKSGMVDLCSRGGGRINVFFCKQSKSGMVDSLLFTCMCIGADYGARAMCAVFALHVFALVA